MLSTLISSAKLSKRTSLTTLLPALFILAIILIFFAIFRLQKSSVSVNSSFVDVTKVLGVRKVKITSPDHPSSLATPGAAWADYDNDGDLDLLVLTLDAEEPNYLYRNNGDGTFTDVTEEAGIFYKGRSWGASLADYDNDGDLDLYVANFGEERSLDSPGEPNILYRNNGDGTFTDVTSEAGVAGTGHSTGPAWGDYNNDGFVDLYVPNYSCIGKGCLGEANNFYVNNGNGTFTEVAKKLKIADIPPDNLPPPENPRRSSLSLQAVWFDYDNDGDLDLFVATDIGTSPLYRNNGDGTFTDVTEEAGLNKFGTGMGVSVADYDNDGDFDLYLTLDGPNYLWKNNGDGTFTEVAGEVGVADELGQGWGVNFFDYDNDGDLDLHVINGADPSLEVRSVDVFYENKDGKFVLVSEEVGIKNNNLSMGAAWGDYDNDGFTDIYVVSANGKNTLYQNQGNNNNWIKIELIGTKSTGVQ